MEEGHENKKEDHMMNEHELAEFNFLVWHKNLQEELEKETDPDLQKVIWELAKLVYERAKLIPPLSEALKSEDENAMARIAGVMNEKDLRIHDLAEKYQFLKTMKKSRDEKPAEENKG